MKKIGKYDIYVEETSPKNIPYKVEWHTVVHDPITMKTTDLGVYSTEQEAWLAAEKFCLGV